jgi:hypothetical protein
MGLELVDLMAIPETYQGVQLAVREGLCLGRQGRTAMQPTLPFSPLGPLTKHLR